MVGKFALDFLVVGQLAVAALSERRNWLRIQERRSETAATKFKLTHYGFPALAPRDAAMARVDLGQFLDKELSRVYIAGGLMEATLVECILTRHAIDYAVEVEPYYKPLPTLFSLGEYAGAAFYVLSAQAPFARSMLLAAGLRAGIQDDEAG